MRLFGKLFKNSDKQPTTVEKVQHLFAYGKMKNLTGTSLPNEKHRLIGNNMDWEAEPYFYKGYKDIPAQNVPAHIRWYNNPVFAYVGIVNDEIEYRFGEQGASAYYICPVTTDSKHITLINEIIETWYSYFELPNSLLKSENPPKSTAREDKMKLIKAYLHNGTEEFFIKTFDDAFDIILVVDWREDDEQIINYCEDILQTNKLSAELNDTTDEIGFELLINYRDKKTKIQYKGIGADRDTTIKTLNAAIQPDFEIRLCKTTVGNDTLGFLPLSRKQWEELENEFAQQVDNHFEKISPDTKLFV